MRGGAGLIVHYPGGGTMSLVGQIMRGQGCSHYHNMDTQTQDFVIKTATTKSLLMVSIYANYLDYFILCEKVNLASKSGKK